MYKETKNASDLSMAPSIVSFVKTIKLVKFKV